MLNFLYGIFLWNSEKSDMFRHNVISHNFKMYITEINFLVNCLITNSHQTFNSGHFLTLHHLQ